MAERDAQDNTRVAVVHGGNENLRHQQADVDELRDQLVWRIRAVEEEVAALRVEVSGKQQRLREQMPPLADEQDEAASAPLPSGSLPSAGKTSKEKRTEEELSYKMRGSVWDCILLLFMPESPLSFFDSLIPCSLFLLNMLTQMIFAYLVSLQAWRLQGNLTGADFQQDALVWRISAGHHVNHYDPFTGTSLATRVCGDYGAEITSSWQQDIYHDIKVYMEGGYVLGVPWGQGPLTCFLLVLVWTVWLLIELQTIWDFSTAIAVAESGPTFLHRRGFGDGKRVYVLRSLGRRRRVLVLLSALARLVVAVVLWFAGVLWLTYTVELDEMIMNAVALGFILECDELLFQLCPKRISNVLRRMEPLPNSLARSPKRWHADAKSVFLLTLMWTALGIWALGPFAEFYNDLRIAENLFCGGDTSFTYAEDPALRVVSLAATGTDSDFRRDFSREGSRPSVFKPVLQRTGLLGALDEIPGILGPYLLELGQVKGPLYQIMDDVDDVVTLSSQSFEDALNGLPCEDMGDSEATRAGMLAVLGVTNCSQVPEMVGCEGTDARVYCPRSCKCHIATSGIYDRTGCSQQCNSLVEEHSASLGDQAFAQGDSCQDLGLEVPQDWYVPFFSQYQQQLEDRGHVRRGTSAITAFSESFTLATLERTGGLWRLGGGADVNVTDWFRKSLAQGWQCRFALYFDKLFSTDVCRSSLAEERGSLEAFCPRTCGLCGVGDVETALEVEWRVLARDLNSIGGELVLSHMHEALQDALDVDVCVRKGDAKGVFNATTVGALHRVGHPATERIFFLQAKSSGTYTFLVNGAPGFDAYLSVWNGVTYEEMYADDDSLGKDPCARVEVHAGERFVLVIESTERYEEGHFELSVLCPWHEEAVDPRCSLHPTPSEGSQVESGTYSLQVAPCESLGLHPVRGAKCVEAAKLLQLRTSASAELGRWAPPGCTYEEHGQILFVDGAGSGECGSVFHCICSSEPQVDVTLSKNCVQLIDSQCRDDRWDSACDDLCTGFCGSACPRPFVVDGPCGLESQQNGTGQEWCISSPNFPRTYGLSEACTVSLGQDSAPRYSPFTAETFELDPFGFDSLRVNGLVSTGDSFGGYVVPTQPLVWTSDGTFGTGSKSYGWRICSTVEASPCASTAEGATDSLGRDCATLEESSLFCDAAYDTENFSAREMCCHCGGGAFDASCPAYWKSCKEGTWPNLKNNNVCGDCKVAVNLAQDNRSCGSYCKSLHLRCVGAWISSSGDCEAAGAMLCDAPAPSTGTGICECAGDEAPKCDEESWPDRRYGLTCGDCRVLVEQYSAKYQTCRGYCSSMGRTCSGAWEGVIREHGVADDCRTSREIGCDEKNATDVICECGHEVAEDFPDHCDEGSWPSRDRGITCGDCKVLVDVFHNTYGTCGSYCASVGRACVAAHNEVDHSGSPVRDTCEIRTTVPCDEYINSWDAICECSTELLPEPADVPPDLCDEEHWPGSILGVTCGDCKLLVGNFPLAYKTCGEYCMSLGRSCRGAWQNDGWIDCDVDGVMGCEEEVSSSTSICECSPEPPIDGAAPDAAEAAGAAVLAVPVGRSPSSNRKCVRCVDASGLTCGASSVTASHRFEISVVGNQLCATRTDAGGGGWDIDLRVECWPG